MYKLYKIISNNSDSFYIGMTEKSLKQRWTGHKFQCRKGTKTPLYDCMRKHGTENFQIVLLDEYKTRDECSLAEIKAIEDERVRGKKILNLANGGDGGFCVSNIDEWRNKLSASRAGGKPFLGFHHSDDAKRKCSAASKEYWDSVKTYDSKEIVSYSFKEAHLKFGISKTHFYRLKKRTQTNDLS